MRSAANVRRTERESLWKWLPRRSPDYIATDESQVNLHPPDSSRNRNSEWRTPFTQTGISSSFDPPGTYLELMDPA